MHPPISMAESVCRSVGGRSTTQTFQSQNQEAILSDEPYRSTHSFVSSFINAFIQVFLFIHTFIHSFIYLFIHSWKTFIHRGRIVGLLGLIFLLWVLCSSWYSPFVCLKRFLSVSYLSIPFSWLSVSVSLSMLMCDWMLVFFSVYTPCAWSTVRLSRYIHGPCE